MSEKTQLRLRTLSESINKPGFNIDLTLQQLKPIFKDAFDPNSWSIHNYELSPIKEQVLIVLDRILENKMYHKDVASFFHSYCQFFVLPALLLLNSTDVSLHVKNTLLFICTSLMSFSFQYVEYLTLLNFYCESLNSIVSNKINELKNNNWIYDLSFSNPVITRYLILSFPSSLSYSQSAENLSQKLLFLDTLVEERPQCFEDDVIDFLIKSLHNCIINNLDVNTVLKKKTIKLFTKFDAICYRRENLIICSSLDRFFQLMILACKISTKDYVNLVLTKKNDEWIENSFFSLETLLFPTVSSWIYSDENIDINWPEITTFLDTAYAIQLSEIKLGYCQDMLYHCVIKLVKPIDIPGEYQLPVKIVLCKLFSTRLFLEFIGDQLRYNFMLLNSYFLFSPSTKLKLEAFKSMGDILRNYPIEMINAFADSMSFLDFIPNLQRCLKYHNLNENSISLKMYYNVSQSLRNHFVFDELYYQFYLFNDIDKINAMIKIISQFPTEFSECKKRFMNYHLSNWNHDVQYAIYNLIFKSAKKTYSILRDALTPKYPAPSRKIVRMYLFLLVQNPFDKILDEHADIVFLDSFRYDDPDIVSAFTTIFESYIIPEKLMIGIIDQLSEQNINLLHVANACPNIKAKIATYEHRFKLVSACVTGNNSYNKSFINLFLDIENEELNYKLISSPNNSPYDILLRSIEFLYITWESYERTAFWKYLTECAYLDSKFQDLILAIKPFIKGMMGDRYVYIDRKLILPLNKKELALDDEKFKQCIKSKIKSHNIRMRFKKAVESSASPTKKAKGANSKANTLETDETEILKIKELEIDAKETRKVVITVYPNGKKIEDDHRESKEKELTSLKRLTPVERKLLFKTELMSKQSSSHYKERVIEMSLFIRQRIAIDIFKGTIQGYHYVGLLVGFLFKTSVNFSIASNEEIQQILTEFELVKNDLTLRLYWWFAQHLLRREFSNKVIQNKVQQVERLLNKTTV